MNDQLISIIIPVFNIDAYLERCISSILNQTYINYEAIFVDDGSTDDSPRKCLKISDEDKRFIYYRVENKGPSFARNFGIEKSHGKYITFIDGDDWVHPNYLDILYCSIIDNQADISMVNYIKTTGDIPVFENKELKYQLFSKQEIIDQYFRNYHPLLSTVWAKLYKRSLFDFVKFEVGRLHEDVFFLYKMLSKAKSVVIADQILYYYWKRPDSITGSFYIERQLDHLDALLERAAFFKENDFTFQFAAQSDSIAQQLLRTIRYIKLSSNNTILSFKDRNNQFIDLIKHSDIGKNKYKLCRTIHKYPFILHHLNRTLFIAQELFSKRSA